MRSKAFGFGLVWFGVADTVRRLLGGCYLGYGRGPSEFEERRSFEYEDRDILSTGVVHRWGLTGKEFNKY